MRTRSLRALVALVLTTGLVAAFAGPAAAGKKPAEVPGFDGTTINLGVITPESGIASIIGKPLTAGNQMWWDYYNDEFGGIGRNGTQLTPEATGQLLAQVGDLYSFGLDVVNNVDGSGGGIKNHGDVTNPRVTYAFACAVAQT